MRVALVAITNTVLSKWATLVASLDTENSSICFPTVVAHTTEGEIMDGPRGLQLITQHGPVPVQQTCDGFVVYKPCRHLLQLTSEPNGMLQQ